MQTPQVAVRPCPPHRRHEALQQLAAAHESTRWQALAEAVDIQLAQQAPEWAGLFIAECVSDGQNDTLCNATWVQLLPGNMAQLWLPAEEDATAQALLHVAQQWVAERALTLCHTVIGPEQRERVVLLGNAGMQLIAPLRYLVAPAKTRLSEKPAPAITLVPWATLTHEEQHALISAVQVDSMDCVALREALGTDALIAGFYQQDAYAAANWYVVHAAWRDNAPEITGVLLLAPRPAVNAWELMLMALLPSWRGYRLGEQLLNAAFRQAQAAGVERVLLSVDATNLPACRLYQRAGFIDYHREDVYAWINGTKAAL
ncbi:GNAT family N-acetyltransferase [Halomonas llamarensis]|uniref:GNAT family N-acetyltransferase n=1 Tax=Halomonas llamarensis TaxID=2945104 RepID=A0ABT0SP83_9GAMM|nr:GNAT family N-acetyltransferase [Halomonas llamarensis]MCL7929622.1 GNAT family N-acetyltransferase [Halomonas llamarensis]